MINSKLLNTIKYILVTILAIFCVSSNVIAARSSLGDSGDTISSTTYSGTVASSGNTRINGTSCERFNVTYEKNVSTTQGASGKKVGPYIGNQGNIRYTVTGVGNGCNGSYVAFCLDPNFDGVLRGQSLLYKSEQVDPNSDFGQKIYALYKIYQQNGSPTDDYNYFSYEVAARILAVNSTSYQSRSNTAKARLNSHLGVYKSGSVPGNNNGAALASQAMSMVSSTSDAMNSTLGLSLNQVGGAAYDGSSYDVLVNVNVENCQSQDCVPDDGSAISGVSGTLQSVSYDEGAKIKTFTYSVPLSGGSDGCASSTINATLSYDSSNDVRNAMQISPVDPTRDDRQNFIVFGSGGGGEVRNSLPINSCGGDDDSDDDDSDDDSCPSDAELACTEDDENFVVVNEGASGGGATDWEGCIIGHTDSRGNSYDVVNTSKLYRENADQKAQINDQEADRTDAILGYTSDTSGGGSKSGDPHSIDDSDFCIVSCKEKYAFILPGNKKEVKQGTYFSFQVNHEWERHAVVGISAERTCVSNGIKNGAFNTRVLDLRKQQVDFYNMYLYYKQLYNAMNSKESMNKYKADAGEQKVQVNLKSLDESPSYNVQDPKHNGKAPADDAIRAENEFNDNNWIAAWDGGGIKVKVRYCKLDDPNGLNSKINCEYYKDVPINAAFSDDAAIGKANLQIPEKKFDGFYTKYYGDYSAAWNTKMNVEEFSKTYSEQSGIVSHTYDYCTGKTHVSRAVREAPGFEPDDDWESAGDGDYYTGCFKTSKTYYATVKYLPEYRDTLRSQWSSYDHNQKVYSKYNNAMTQLKNAYMLAKQKYEALNAQIGIQSDAMQECTNYLDNFSQEKNPYRFDPIITFSYPSQPTYMKMLAPNRLENMNEGTPQVKYEKYFCGGGICLGGGGGATATNFQFGNIYSDPGEGLINNVNEAKDKNVPKKFETDVTEYYNVGSVGSRSTYGRFSADGSDGCSSSYRADAGGRNDYCYEFYQSAKPFYTQAPDGIVTTTPSGENKTILSTDGRVYPVAITTPAGEYPFYVSFANIGQFTESTSLGRIMGGGDGKKGTMSGEYGDTEVCFYEVCRVDDPDCGKPKDQGACSTIVEKYCNNGAVDNVQYLNDENYEKCLQRLMNVEKDENGNPVDCCNYVKEFKEKRTGKWAKLIPTSIWSKYSKRCDNTNACTSFTIISSDYTGAITNISDVSGVNNDGSLQVNARAVSLNNLFPNNEKGINWNTSEAQSAMVEIESIGEGIFATDCRNSSDSNCHGLDYSAVIDSKCADEIRKYNLNQEGDGSGYGNGGFNDYTNNITNAHTDLMSTGNIKNHDYGQTAEMDSSFRSMVEKYCSFEGKAAPDLIVDSSSLVLEPWQYMQ